MKWPCPAAPNRTNYGGYPLFIRFSADLWIRLLVDYRPTDPTGRSRRHRPWNQNDLDPCGPVAM